MTQQTADKIRNSECIIMEGIGHFPMSENPELFKEYLMPVLKKIVQADREAGRSSSDRDYGQPAPAPRGSQRDDSHGRDRDHRSPPSHDAQRSSDRGTVRVLELDTSSGRSRR